MRSPPASLSQITGYLVVVHVVRGVAGAVFLVNFFEICEVFWFFPLVLVQEVVGSVVIRSVHDKEPYRRHHKLGSPSAVDMWWDESGASGSGVVCSCHFEMLWLVTGKVFKRLGFGQTDGKQ
ncbi:hypothetical protein DFJ77DRAFT_474945 [Powellomyces hirtus]|nr:hypothetical protein DFJ77DRAFT_474945 [Powellomyces hirtus]